MKQKSRLSVKLAAVLLAGVVGVCCFTTACQPTPEKPVVVNKNQSYDDIVKGETKQTEESEPYSVPEIISEHIENGNLTIDADTPVELPQTTGFPVIIMKQRIFSQQEVDKIVDYFVQGRKIYKQKTFETKDDIMDMITEAKRGQLVDGKYDSSQVNEDWINELEKRYEEAPATFEKEYVDSSLDYGLDDNGVPLSSGEKSQLYVNIENDDGIEETLSISNANEQNTMTWVSYRDGTVYYDETFYIENLDAPDIDAKTDPNFQDWENQIKNTSMTKEQAIAQGDAILAGFNIEGLTLVEADRAAILDSAHHPCKGGYKLTYVRSKGNLTGFVKQYGMSCANEEKLPEYAPPFMQERLEIMLNEDGLHNLYWGGIVSEEVVNKNAQLKPFDEIQQAAFNQIKYKKSFMAKDDTIVRCELESVKLYLGYISVKDDVTKAMMVPMWLFVTDDYVTFGSDEEIDWGEEATAVNALDGSIVSIMPYSDKFSGM